MTDFRGILDVEISLQTKIRLHGLILVLWKADQLDLPIKASKFDRQKI